MSGDIAAFIRARLDEREAAARAASDEHLNPESRGGRWQVVGRRNIRYGNGAGETIVAVDVTGGPCLWHEQITVRGDPDCAVADYIARYDPAWALADIAAKRAILDLYERTAKIVSGETERMRRGDPPAFPARDYLDAERELCALRPAVLAIAAIDSGHADYEAGWAA